MERIGDSESAEQLSRFALRFPPSEFGEIAFQLGGAQSVLFGKLLFGIDLIPFFHDRVELLISHDDRIQNRVLVECEVVLAQGCKPLAGGNDDLTGIRFDFTAENLQKRGFSRTVRSNDPITVSGGKLDVYLLEENLRAV